MAEQNKRVALIAGACGGIGTATALKLAASSHCVYLAYRRKPERASELAARIGDNAQVIELDLADHGSCERACEDIFKRERRLDILVNAAAINLENPAMGMDFDAWETVLKTNLDGAFALATNAAKFMLLNKWGRIVNISSIAAAHGGRGQISYSVSKSGVETMSRVLALELGRKGILVNCVAPGVIETEMSERIRTELSETLLERISVRRFGKPAEVAELISFLVSDAASYLNGQLIRVDGGMML